MAYFLLHRWDYNALEGGEDVATGLGVHVESLRFGSVSDQLGDPRSDLASGMGSAHLAGVA